MDFVAPSVRLVVDVDGAYHARRVTADARRDRTLKRLGYRVLRLGADLVCSRIPKKPWLASAQLSLPPERYS